MWPRRDFAKAAWPLAFGMTRPMLSLMRSNRSKATGTDRGIGGDWSMRLSSPAPLAKLFLFGRRSVGEGPNVLGGCAATQLDQQGGRPDDLCGHQVFGGRSWART